MSEFYQKIQKMMFRDIDDLFSRRKEIRQEFNQVDAEVKEMYKWFYYFQLCLLKNPLKSTMWEYINGFKVENKLKQEYFDFCNKRKKINYN